MRNLLEEILDYGELKRRWGYGHIRIIKSNYIWESHFCDRAYRISTFYGYYVNKRGEKNLIHLGNSYLHALLNVNDKKSLLSQTPSLGDLAIKTD